MDLEVSCSVPRQQESNSWPLNLAGLPSKTCSKYDPLKVSQLTHPRQQRVGSAALDPAGLDHHLVVLLASLIWAYFPALLALAVLMPHAASTPACSIVAADADAWPAGFQPGRRPTHQLGQLAWGLYGCLP